MRHCRRLSLTQPGSAEGAIGARSSETLSEEVTCLSNAKKLSFPDVSRAAYASVLHFVGILSRQNRAEDSKLSLRRGLAPGLDDAAMAPRGDSFLGNHTAQHGQPRT